MSKILVIGNQGDVARNLRGEQPRSRMTMTTEAWTQKRQSKNTLTDASAVLLDLTDPDAPGLRSLSILRRRMDRRPTLLVIGEDSSRLKALQSLLDDPEVDFARSSDMGEIRCRLERLLRHHPYSDPTSTQETVSTLPQQRLLPKLHDPRNGRLDAKRIAAFFGIALADIARVLGISLSRLHKTPSAPSAQEALYPFERIAYALLTLVGAPEAARAWLNLPETQLAEQTPLAALLDGRGALVADLLDDMMIGQAG